MNPCVKCGGDAQRETDGERRWYECMDCHQKTDKYEISSFAGDDWDKNNPVNNSEETQMRKEPNPPEPEGVEIPEPPPGPSSSRGVLHLGPGETFPAPPPPPIFNNPTAQRAYEALMADARRREKDLHSSSLNPNDVHQFMLDAHALALRTAYEISMEGIRAINDTSREIDSTEGK